MAAPARTKVAGRRGNFPADCLPVGSKVDRKQLSEEGRFVFANGLDTSSLLGLSVSYALIHKAT
jgi:hypothetical protein